MGGEAANPAARGAVLAAVLLGGLIGVSAGVGAYTFTYAKGTSYLFDDPAACANCHVMQGHYDAWLKSSHRHVAACNDCHTPDGWFSKYYVKALNGWHHSVAFTLGNFDEPIRIKPFNKAITESACRKCHEGITSAIDPHHAGMNLSEPMSCIRCHGDVGHMR